MRDVRYRRERVVRLVGRLCIVPSHLKKRRVTDASKEGAMEGAA
jgi:hypothetical protein